MEYPNFFFFFFPKNFFFFLNFFFLFLSFYHQLIFFSRSNICAMHFLRAHISHRFLLNSITVPYRICCPPSLPPPFSLSCAVNSTNPIHCLVRTFIILKYKFFSLAPPFFSLIDGVKCCPFRFSRLAQLLFLQSTLTVCLFFKSGKHRKQYTRFSPPQKKKKKKKKKKSTRVDTTA